jgi:iron complex outermembrane receptor protein
MGSNTLIPAYNPYDLLDAGAIQQGDYLYDDILEKSWTVEEDVHTAYVKFDFDTEFLGLPLNGNFGLAYQWWDQASFGQNAAGSGSALITSPFADSYSDNEALPSLNLSWELNESTIVRFGAARTVARPRMDDLNASGFVRFETGGNKTNPDTGLPWQQADVDAFIPFLVQNFGLSPEAAELEAYRELSPWVRNGGNIRLRPWVANGYDLSIERYFEDSASYLAFAVFHKDLKSYIFDQTLLFDFTGSPLLGLDDRTDITVGTSTSAANGSGGEIKGWEVSATLMGDLLSRRLQGFGINANFSQNDSDIEPNGPGSGSSLPGLSDEVWSITAFYERNGFSARINQRYRDGFVGEVAGFGGARTGSDIAEETIVDAQVSYQFQSGPLEGLTLLAQGYNLTDEPFQSVDVFTGLPTEFQTFGASYLIGFNYPIVK